MASGASTGSAARRTSRSSPRPRSRWSSSRPGISATWPTPTVLLLLVVFTAVNIAVLVLRRDRVDHRHFRAPTIIPPIGAVVSVALMTTKDADVFERAGSLLVVGLALWVVNWWLHGRHVEPFHTEQLEVVERRELT